MDQPQGVRGSIQRRGDEVPNGFTEQDRDDFDHLKRDMWFGNGKPGITTRVSSGEDRMTALEKNVSQIKTMFWAIVLLLLTILGTVIGSDILGPHVAQGQPSHSDLYYRQ